MHLARISQEEYCAYQESHPLPFFQQVAWHQLLRSAFRVETICLGFFEGGRMVGVLPIMIREKCLFTLRGMPLPELATPLTLLTIDATCASAPSLLATIDRWVGGQKWPYLQLACPNAGSRVPGIVEERRQIVEIDLARPLETVWEAIKGEARNRIRFAVRSKVRVHVHAGDRYLDEYPRLLNSVYREAQGTAPNTPLALFAAIRRRKQSLPLKVFTATLADRVVAMLWVFHDQQACYYWEGASDELGRRCAANHLLHWEVIRWAHRQGIKRYDLCGTSGRGGGREGILRFKLSLGAQLRECRMLFWFANPVVRTMFYGYRAGLAFRQRIRRQRRSQS